MLRGKYIALNAYIRKKGRFKINHPKLYLGKGEQHKPKPSRRKKILKIRAEVHEIEKKETIEIINEYKCWFFKKINKIKSSS